MRKLPNFAKENFFLFIFSYATMERVNVKVEILQTVIQKKMPVTRV